MLMGLRYHHGNGDPFYYEGDGVNIEVSSMLDANTLEPMIQHDPDGKRWLTMEGRRGHKAWVRDNLAARDARIAKRNKV